MKLLCTFSQAGFDVTRKETGHRIYLDFVTRIGLDGKTPFIGNNGNWWIGDADTGTPAVSVKRYPSRLQFPVLGTAGVLYLDEGENRLYRWNTANLYYYCVGSDYTEIQIIDGGNA